MKNKAINLFTVVVLCLCFCVAANAQANVSGSLRGMISDSNRAAISGAFVRLVNRQTNAELMTATDDAGLYSFARLAPGVYVLTVEQNGFQKAVVEDIEITVNQAATADLELRVGNVSATVTAESGAPPVQTQSTEVSALVDGLRVRELPLNGKNFQRLMLLAPGVGGGRFSNPSISGARPTANTYTVDGTTANDEREQLGLSLGGGAASFSTAAPNLVSTEAIQEFRLITSNADATFGRGSGGQTNIITRSGSNDWRGSAYGFLRNDAFDARDFFNRGPFFETDGGAKVPPFRQYQYGGSIGGRIVRDKHFFFGNFERFDQRLQRTASFVVPNAALINLIPGDLGRFYRAYYIERGAVPATGDPAGAFEPLSDDDRAAAIAAGFNPTLFDGNAGNGEAGTSLVSTSPTRDTKQNAFLIRTDHNFTSRLNANFRYAQASPEQTANFTGIPNDDAVSAQRWQTAATQFVYTINSRQILELRGGLMRSRIGGGNPGAVEPLTRIGVSREVGILVASPFEFLQVGGTAGYHDEQSIPQFSVLHTFARGKLTLRSGADVRRLSLDITLGFNATPYYELTTFIGPTGLLGASPTQAQAVADYGFATVFGANGGPTSARRRWNATQQEYFAQTDWRASERLTLNLGVRYSYFGVFRERDNAASNLFAVDAGGRVLPNVEPFAGGRTANAVFPLSDDLPLFQPDKNNFQPRVGLAWNVGGRGSRQSVIRAAYGLYHDRLYQRIFSDGVGNVPFAFASFVPEATFRLGQPFPVNTDAPFILSVDPTIKNPFTHRFNFAFEQQLDASTSVTAAYVGSRSRSLIRPLQPNNTDGSSFPQPDPRFADQLLLDNISFADYDALQIFGQRRFARGFSFTAAYTFGRSRDDNSNDITSFAPSFGVIDGRLANRPVSADRGASDFDVRHNFTFSHLFELPFGGGRRFWSDENNFVNTIVGGWSLNGVGVIRSGEPFSVTLGSGFRPVRIGGSLEDLYATGGDKTQYLIPRAQAQTILSAVRTDDPTRQIPRNAFRAPMTWFYDVSLVKRARIAERVGLNFEINAFNVFNRVNFGAPIGDLRNVRFGQLTRTLADSNPRQLQFGLKLTF